MLWDATNLNVTKAIGIALYGGAVISVVREIESDVLKFLVPHPPGLRWLPHHVSLCARGPTQQDCS